MALTTIIIISIVSIICPPAFSMAAETDTPTENLKILSISETSETSEPSYYNALGFYMHLLDRYVSPVSMLGEQYDVHQVGWLEADAFLAKADSYNTIILWDAPASIEDKRNDDIYHSNIEVISDKTADQLIGYIKGGGSLIIAGGVTCFGDGHPKLNSAQSTTANMRSYTGYHGSPLAEILPVEIEPGQSLAYLDRPESIKQSAHPVLKAIDLRKWPVNAYHKLKAKNSAQVIAKTGSGEPLIALGQYHNGRVAAVMLSPRGNMLFKNPQNPLWPKEAVLWDRLIRWTMNSEMPKPEREKTLIERYKTITAAAEPVPSKIKLAEFPYATHVLRQSIPEPLIDLSYKYFSDLNFNHIIFHGFHSIGSREYQTNRSELKRFFDFYTEPLAKNNLQMIVRPCFASVANAERIDPNLWAQRILPSGEIALHYGKPNPCPYSPLVQRLMVSQMKQFMPAMKHYPNIRGIVSDDEWAWILGYRNAYEGAQGIACYSPWVNEYYEKLTGSEPPKPVYKQPGYVAAEDDPWLNWCIKIRQDSHKQFNEKLDAEAKKIRPDFLVSNYPGGFSGVTGWMIEEVYLDCWRQSPLLAAERIDVRANFRKDKYRDKYPIWALVGIFRMPEDKSMYPETMRLTAGLCIGSGVKGMILWNSENLWGQYFQHKGRVWLEEEAKQLGQYLHKYGDMFSKLKKTPADVWMLSGWFWINSFDNYLHIPPPGVADKDKDMEMQWWNFQVMDVAGPAAMRAGLYLEYVTEKQLVSDELFEKKAVILPGLIYSRQSVIDNLEKFTKKGGLVFTDKSAKINIDGAKTLDVDFGQWHKIIAAGKRPTIRPTEINYRKQMQARDSYVREAIPQMQKQIAAKVDNPVKLSSTKTAHLIMHHGATRYIFVYNTDTDNAGRTDVSCTGMGSVVYDINGGRLLESSADSFTANLTAGGWKVYALCEQKLNSVEIEKTRMSGNSVNIVLRVADEEGKVFDSAVPMEIKLIGKNGKTYLVYQSTEHGKLAVTIPCEQSVPIPEKIEVKELFSGKQSTTRI